jgi:hypothetical protein
MTSEFRILACGNLDRLGYGTDHVPIASGALSSIAVGGSALATQAVRTVDQGSPLSYPGRRRPRP